MKKQSPDKDSFSVDSGIEMHPLDLENKGQDHKVPWEASGWRCTGTQAKLCRATSTCDYHKQQEYCSGLVRGGHFSAAHSTSFRNMCFWQFHLSNVFLYSMLI